MGKCCLTHHLKSLEVQDIKYIQVQERGLNPVKGFIFRGMWRMITCIKNCVINISNLKCGPVKT
jgi:hypothetical protein